MRPFKKKKPVKKPQGNYAFIDSQNLNLGTQKMGWKMDWKKFREWLRDNYNVEKAFMFIGYMPDFEPLYDQLHSQGYAVVLKPTTEMFNIPETEGESTKPKNEDKKDKEKPAAKGNVDTDLVLHVMKEWDNYEKAIIVSGDGDFYTLIEHLDQQGKLLHVLTPNWQYSSLLKLFDKYIVRLDQFKGDLRYPDYRNRNKHRQTGKSATASKRQKKT